MVLEPANAEMQALGKKIRVVQRDQAKKDSKIYSKMFSKPGICSKDASGMSRGLRKSIWHSKLESYLFLLHSPPHPLSPLDCLPCLDATARSRRSFGRGDSQGLLRR
jgi:hypothetical protein